MRRMCLIVLAAGVAALASLLAPGAASAAGVFTWNLASDFTGTGAGANPDHDQYGRTPWKYVEGPVSTGVFQHAPANFTPMPSFSTADAAHGGLAGWSDTTDPAAFIGINPTAAAITQSPVSYPAHAIAVQPAANRLVAVGWTSPFSTATTVAVSGTVAADDANPACLLAEPGWSLDQNGSQLLSGSPVNGGVSDFVTVQPGGTIYLTVTPGSSASCSNVSLALTIQAAPTAPAVTLVSPAPGATIAGGQPTFAGSAGSNFADSPTVTVRVYTGSSASGAPFETLTGTAAGGSYQVGPTTPLADGTYTAQAEQDTAVGPPQVGLSAAVTFTVQNGGPKVTLNPLGSTPLHTATPTLTGTAGTTSGDGGTVTVSVYAGAGENGSPLRVLHANVGSGGAFSAPITPALPDGQYTAVATQSGAGGGTGISPPMTFVLKANAPTLTLTTPATGASVIGATPVFSGAAGAAIGDSAKIAVTVYKGGSLHGKRVGRFSTTASGGKWLLIWPHQLPLGLYIAQASQSDNAGHTTRSAAHRFLIVPGPKVIGATVKLSGAGEVSVPISCLAPQGTTCAGDILIVTQSKFQPTAGGPLGRLRLLFAFVKIPAGKTVVVSAKVSGAVARILRHAAPLKVEVTVSLKANGKVTSKLTGGSTLRVR